MNEISLEEFEPEEILKIAKAINGIRFIRRPLRVTLSELKSRIKKLKEEQKENFHEEYGC